MLLDRSALQEFHRMFAEECDPVSDAQLAASAIYWAPRLDGPIEAAASRIRLLHAPAAARRHFHLTEGESLDAYMTELRALALARHAGYWLYLTKAFDSRDTLEGEVQVYGSVFAVDLEHHLKAMEVGRFQPTPPNAEALKPWAVALSLHGSFWVDGRERGVPEAALMRTLWAAPPILRQPGKVLPGPYVAPEGSLHPGATNMDALEAILRVLEGPPEQGRLYRVTYGHGEHHPTFIGEYVGCTRDMLTGYPEPALRWIIRNPALPSHVGNGTEADPFAIWPVDIEHIVPAKPSDMEQALLFEVEGEPALRAPEGRPPAE